MKKKSKSCVWGGGGKLTYLCCPIVQGRWRRSWRSYALKRGAASNRKSAGISILFRSWVAPFCRANESNFTLIIYGWNMIQCNWKLRTTMELCFLFHYSIVLLIIERKFLTVYVIYNFIDLMCHFNLPVEFL